MSGRWSKVKAGGMWAVVLAVLAFACTGPEASEAATQAHPQELDRILAELRAQELQPQKIQRLRSGRELPECSEAEWRYRLHFGAFRDGDFVNVSHFAREEEAEACHEAFSAMVAKAGRSAIEAMGDDAQLRGALLYVFPTTAAGHELREQIFPDTAQAERR